ncbi:hypothetical protein GGX14DRAFT_392695 [Mycena pura]|uniref:Uncharacterized protein n=1 Tax=Mycena pura TaxID=153505 RepID=A0AAD6YCP8_9AGAR|nr:hypothetical protein GGX14DRAFT_392695 [Mycena pura]
MPDFSDDDYYNPPPRYDPEIAHTLPNVMRRILMLVTDDILKSNFAMLLCGTKQDGNYARPYCYYSQLRNRNYALWPYVNTLFTNRLETCAGLIFTALNDHTVDNRGFIREFHPVTVPAEALRQCNIRVIPSILLFLLRDWTLFPKEFATKFGVKKHSLCNPGASLGMTKDEFISRTSRWHSPGINLLDTWFDELINCHNEINRADDAAAGLFAPEPVGYFLGVVNPDGTQDGSMFTIIPHIPAGPKFLTFTHRIDTSMVKLEHGLATPSD